MTYSPEATRGVLFANWLNKTEIRVADDTIEEMERPVLQLTDANTLNYKEVCQPIGQKETTSTQTGQRT